MHVGSGKRGSDRDSSFRCAHLVGRIARGPRKATGSRWVRLDRVSHVLWSVGQDNGSPASASLELTNTGRTGGDRYSQWRCRAGSAYRRRRTQHPHEDIASDDVMEVADNRGGASSASVRVAPMVAYKVLAALSAPQML